MRRGQWVSKDHRVLKDRREERGHKVYKVNIFIGKAFVTNGFAMNYHFGEFTFTLRGIRSDLKSLFHFNITFHQTNIGVQDGTPRSAKTLLGPCCLPRRLMF